MMRANKEIDTDMFYWCDGMAQWEKFHPKRDIDKITAIKPDAYFPFETGVPPPAPWKKKNWGLRVAVLLSLLACLGIFLLAWQKHTAEAQAEVAKSHAASSAAEKFRREIKSGAAYAKNDWPGIAAASGMVDMDSAQAFLGAPNKVADGGYRWIFFDRMIHPVTGLETDLCITFDREKKITGFDTYP